MIVSYVGVVLVVLDSIPFFLTNIVGSDSDTVDDEDEPVLDTVNVIHDGGVNRIRVCIL